MENIQPVEKLQRLLQVPDEQRDIGWEHQFFAYFTKADVYLLAEHALVGPDGWPYLHTVWGDDEKKRHDIFKNPEPVQKLLHWVADKGIGLVLNPDKDFPDYVFTYGMIWHFRETGWFFKEDESILKGADSKFSISNTVKIGEPSKSILPDYVRKVLKQFFLDQGLYQVKVAAAEKDSQKFDLLFSLESFGNPPENERQGVLEAISWFLPPHYSLAFASENDILEFVPLA